MDNAHASELILHALACAVGKDTNGAATALDTLAKQSTDNQMYGVCCAIAAAGVHALKKIYGERAANLANGDMWALQELVPGSADADPPHAFAIRFLVAYANEDTATTLALYDVAAGASGEQYVDSVCALLSNVAGITRTAIDMQQGSR